MKRTITLLTFAVIAATIPLLGCEVPLEESIVEVDHPLGDLAGDAVMESHNPVANTRDGDDPGPETIAADDPSGQILVANLEYIVEVGEFVVFTFGAELHDIDPEDTYFTVDALPDGATIDLNAGIFEWTPTDADIGIHMLGIDLWDGGSERILDAQRIAIEVLPGNNLIEVGI